MLTVGLFLRPALADPTVHRASRPLMGTRVDVVAQGQNSDSMQAAVAAAFAEMARLEGLMSRYRRDSAVAALHAAAGRHPIPVPPELISVLQMAQKISERSHGAFDVTVGAFSGWNFSAKIPMVPLPQELQSARQLVNYRDLIIDEKNRHAYLRRAGMQIDLGGIAKLPILQAGMNVLRQHGVRDAMINGGGDVLVHGQLQGRDWRIGIRDPLHPEQLLGVVTLNEGWVASSGDYERCFEFQGRRYHHVLDPRTGWPSRGPHGVALVARDMEAVNGLGAAIMVMGAPAGRRLLASRPVVDALIVDAGQQLWLSGGMTQRLQHV